MIRIDGYKKSIKFKRKRKNPNLKNEEFIDDTFINFLLTSFTTDDDLDYGNRLLSYALIYKNIGNSYCEDCSDELHRQNFVSCSCEYCDKCGQNICSCDLNTRTKLRKYIIHLAIKYLNSAQLLEFRNRLEWLDYQNEFKSYIKSLDNYIK